MARHADSGDEVDEFRAARQEHVLPVIHFMAVDFERRRAAAEKPAALEDVDDPSLIFEIDGGSESRETCADDRYPTRSHDPIITRSFSVRVKRARSRSGNTGSRSIFSRMRS